MTKIIEESGAQPDSANAVLAEFKVMTNRTVKPTIVSEQELIFEGNRNDVLTSLAGSMRARGMDADAILAALEVHNQKRCEPPLEDAEVAVIARSVGRYAPNHPTHVDRSEHMEDDEPDQEDWPVVLLDGPVREKHIMQAQAGLMQHRPEAFFQRAGQIVQIVTPQWFKNPQDDCDDNETKLPWLNVLSPIVVAMEFEQAAIFKKFDRRSNQWMRKPCPDALGKAYIDNSNLWRCNELLGLLDHPIITSQGGIVMKRGYDQKSKLFFVHRLEIDPIQDHV
ncbi:MAG: primase C-terminal domain-containing protein, partial [Methylococcales bacterium]